jgi:hypothetical protein
MRQFCAKLAGTKMHKQAVREDECESARKGLGFKVWQTWVQSPALPFTSCIIAGMFFNINE